MIAFGQALGTPLIGFLIDLTNPQTAFWIAAGVALAGATLLPKHGSIRPSTIIPAR